MIELNKHVLSKHTGKSLGFLSIFYWLLIFGTMTTCHAQTSLNVTNFGARGDAVQFSVNTVSGSTVVSAAGTNTFSSADIGKVIEVFRAGPLVNYDGGVVVTQQDIVSLITGVSNGTNLSMSIPCGWTMNAYCVVGTNNAPAFQAAINAASNLVATAGVTNVTIDIPSGTYLLASPQVLNPAYVMASASDTHAAITISSGGITLKGEPSAVLMGIGAGMEHLVGQSLTWISSTYAPYLPMRDTLVICQGPVQNSQYPLVFQNLTFDGGLTNGVQPYNYFTLIQGNGEGWDTTHHAVADSGGVNNVNGQLVQWQMNQMKLFTNCIFQHWRGEMLICWTGDITNAFNDLANCTFYDGNATADNMYYGQHIHGCTFNNVLKITEYYQGNASLPTVVENNFSTNLAGTYAITIVGATTNATPPSFTIRNNVFHEETGINGIQFSPAANVSVLNNTFIGTGGGVVFTSAGLQPSDGSAIPVMTNFVVAGNSFFCGNPLSMDGYPVNGMIVSNNVGLNIIAAAGYKDHITVVNNKQGINIYGGPTVNQTGIQSGNYMLDESNQWAVPTEPIDAGDYAITNLLSYGNGIVHLLRGSGSVFYLDDTKPQLIPTNEGPIALTIYAQTWTGENVTNFYTSARSPGRPITITNGAPAVTFYWNGSGWGTNTFATADVSMQFKVKEGKGVSRFKALFTSPKVDGTGATIKTRQWIFGDGTGSTLENPDHIYTNVGTYYATLTVQNSRGFSSLATGTIVVTNPVIKFTASKTNNVCPGYEITFKCPATDSGKNKIKSWLWNFGDGNTSTSENPKHAYAAPDLYNPTLTVVNEYGLSPTTMGPAVNVTFPTVKFTATPISGTSRVTVHFKSPSEDSTGEQIKGWQWNFGDGSYSKVANPTHTYTNTGTTSTFRPALTVTNRLGLFPTTSGPTITVGGASAAIRATSLVTANAPPTLSLTLSGPNVILSWPTNATGFTLQCVGDPTCPTGPTDWMCITSPPVVINGQNIVTNSVSAPQMFFRLSQ